MSNVVSLTDPKLISIFPITATLLQGYVPANMVIFAASLDFSYPPWVYSAVVPGSIPAGDGQSIHWEDQFLELWCNAYIITLDRLGLSRRFAFIADGFPCDGVFHPLSTFEFLFDFMTI